MQGHEAFSGGMVQAAMGGIPYFKEIAIFLVTSALVVPVCRRLGISPVLGFLGAGALIGPFGFALIDDAEGVGALAELGVVFLLFMIGLELSFERLRAMRRMVFGLGAAQVIVTAVVISAIAYYWGNSPSASIIIGLALSLSSTAIVMQLLVERGEIAQRHGRASFSILLFQDLAVVPILMLVTVLNAPDSQNLGLDMGLAALKAVVAVAIIIVVGRLGLRRLYKAVAGAGSREALLAVSLFVVLVTAVVTQEAGLSAALGAFLAGLLLAETEYRHQVESDIEPFKGLLLGLFFISVGMSLDFAQVAGQAYWLSISLAGLIAIKAAIAGGLCLLFGLPLGASVRSALILSTGGEFAFVIFNVATIPVLSGDQASAAIVEPATAQFMTILASLSMVTTPLLAIAGSRLAPLLSREKQTPGQIPEDLDEAEGHVIIAGFGRVGQTVARLLDMEKVPYLALDMDAARVADFQKKGESVYFGDATRPEILSKVHPEKAIAVLLTIDDPDGAQRAVEAVRSHWPELPIVARSSDGPHGEDLRRLGANVVVPETLEASLQLGGALLRQSGTSLEAVAALAERIREESYESIGKTV